MIIDIDKSETVKAIVERVSQNWFNPIEMYGELKASGKTNSPNFWENESLMLTDLSGGLGLTSTQFMTEWDHRCISSNVQFMGYHCTRHSNKQVFFQKGILPLSKETIKLSDDKDQTVTGEEIWEYRYQHRPGPYFLLSYKYAARPQNSFFQGPEILLACSGHHVDVDPKNSLPLIIHCVIPYSFLSKRLFCALLIDSVFQLS